MTFQSRSETFTAPTGAFVEVGTVTHHGRDFSALGSTVDLDRGEVCGYVKRDASGVLYLSTWSGECLYITLRPVSTWRTPRSFVSSTMTAYRAMFGDYVWHGRGAGEGMFLRLKKGRAVTGLRGASAVYRKVSS